MNHSHANVISNNESINFDQTLPSSSLLILSLSLPLPLPLSQHDIMASTRTYTSGRTDLPIAALDQLQWVKIIPKVSLLASTSTSTSIPASVVDHPLWWPCLMFNEYVDFQDFFQDELEFSDVDDDDDDDNDNNIDDDIDTSTITTGSEKKKVEVVAAALEARRLILSRIFANMLQLQRNPIMVARLLGRSIQDHIEVVVGLSEIEIEKEEEAQTLKSYQATEYMPFTALSSHEILRQMDPKAFAVVVDDIVSNGPTTTTTIIDDELYMDYLLALDLAATQRMGGLIAPNKTLRSDFRDIGRAELNKLPPTIKKLSDTTTCTLATSIATTTCAVTADHNSNNDDVDVDVDRMEEDPKEEDNSDSSIVITMTKRMKLKLQSEIVLRKRLLPLPLPLPLMMRKRYLHNQRKQKILKRWTMTMHQHQHLHQRCRIIPRSIQTTCTTPLFVSATSTDTFDYSSDDDDDIIKEEHNEHDEEHNNDDLEEDEPPSLSSSPSPIVTTISSTSSHENEDGVVHDDAHNENDDIRVRTLFDKFLDDLNKYYPIDLVEDVLVLCNCCIMKFTNRSGQLVNYFIID